MFKIKYFQRINKKHKICNFSTNNLELKKFLLEDALDNQKKLLSVTYLWFNENNEILTYITLLNDRINLVEKLHNKFKNQGVHYKSLPALKIGRLCVSEKYKKKGLGSLLINFAIDKASLIFNNASGCRFLTVDAKDDSVQFYKKQGFRILKKNVMYYDVLENQSQTQELL